MRIHFSSIATIIVALLFISGTVGCRSNGGDWYKPGTYSWVNPFEKSSQESPRSSGTLAKSKPSLNEHPNISTPQGGYSAGASSGEFAASPSSAGTLNSSVADSWGGQHNPMASQVPPSHLSGYTVAEPSPYPPSYMVEGQNMVGSHSVAAAPMQHPHSQFPQEMAQQQNLMPYGPSDYVRTGLHQQVNTANTSVYQQPAQQTQMGVQGNYAPFGVAPQSDPYAAIQQPAAVPPMGFGYEQQLMQQQMQQQPPMQQQLMHAPQQGVPAESGNQQQMYQTQPTGGVSYW